MSPPANATNPLDEPGVVSRVMHQLLFTGSAVLVVVWILEWSSGVITPWDTWLLPLLAIVVAGSATAMIQRPALDPALRVVPVAAFNVYLVVTLHLTLLLAEGGTQWYQTITTLYWMPLAYGCAFVFLQPRAALLVSGLTASGSFLPLLLWSQLGQLPTWTHESGPLLVVVALAHCMFVVLLSAVVKLRNSHDEAQTRITLMRTLASTDVLTGLPNRRSMLEQLDAAMALSRRTGQPVSVALIDVDHFKAVNDRHGHAAGDAVLVQLGELMRTQLRGSDGLARWGGEEFLLCAPATSVSAATDLAERVRDAVAQWPFPHGQTVTISVGLTQCLAGDAVDSLLQRADRALYQAKARGRNRTEALVVGVAG